MKITINKEGYPHLFLALALAALTTFFKIPLGTYFFIFLAAFFAIFFRDPERIVPHGKNILVSPADGKILSIKSTGSQKEVHIFLGPLDVHINRAPMSGTVQKILRRAGKHKLAFRASAELNEENYIIITSGKRKVTVVQIVGFMARRIKCWIVEHQKVEIGQKIGMIIFGSGTKLILPASAKILVKEKQRVKGGETIIARF